MRHGYAPERSVQAGIGALDMCRPKVRDRAAGVPVGKGIRFSSAILPRRARRSKSLDALLPVLCLRGISTGDVQEALSELAATAAPTLSPNVISRLTGKWQQAYDRRQRRDLRVGGVYLQARMEARAEGMPVVLVATREGKMEFDGFRVGERPAGRRRARVSEPTAAARIPARSGSAAKVASSAPRRSSPGRRRRARQRVAAAGQARRISVMEAVTRRGRARRALRPAPRAASSVAMGSPAT